MQYILLLPLPALLFSAALFVGFALLVALTILKQGRRRLGLTERHVPVPAFMGTIATAWALSLGFAASDLWNLGGRADQAIAAERSAVMRLLGVAAPEALGAPELHESVLRYITLVESKEGVRHLSDASGDPSVDAAIQAIRIAMIRTASSDIPSAVGAKIVGDFDELQEARSMRLGTNASLIDSSKWHLLLTFTFLTMLTIAILHADRPVAGRTATVIFAITALAGLWILVIHVDPFNDIRDDYLSHGVPAIARLGAG